MDAKFIQAAVQKVDQLAAEVGENHLVIHQFRRAIRKLDTNAFFRAMVLAGRYEGAVQEAFVRAFG